MTTDVPRRLRPNSAQRTNKILTQTRGAPSAKGSTAAARPVSTLHRAQQYIPPAASPGRLSVFYTVLDTTTLTGDVFAIPTWGVFETVGTAVALATPDDGVIHIIEPGVFAVNLGLTLPAGVAGAVVGCSVRLYADLIVAYGATDIGCGLRGGDGCADVPTFAAASYVYSFPAGGSIAPVLTYQNLDTTAVPHIDVNVDVVRLG